METKWKGTARGGGDREQRWVLAHAGGSDRPRGGGGRTEFFGRGGGCCRELSAVTRVSTSLSSHREGIFRVVGIESETWDSALDRGSMRKGVGLKVWGSVTNTPYGGGSTCQMAELGLNGL